MSNPARAARAATDMMVAAGNTALKDLGATILAAAVRAFEELKTAENEDEIIRIRDVYVSSVANFGSTVFVSRS